MSGEKLIDWFISLTVPLLWIWVFSVAIFIWWVFVVVPDQTLFGPTKFLMKLNIFIGMTSYILSIFATLTCIVRDKTRKPK
ncbi:hypothetical protein HYW55_00235 [Candidatus Gottesmanbacteria bacterium]|nr:hypothetical protein [Candidatus Gottesmanbacteria bacterium]